VLAVFDMCVDLVMRGNVRPRFQQLEQIIEDYFLEMGGSANIFISQMVKLCARGGLIGWVGKDSFGVPMINGLYSLITILLSLTIYHRVPERPNLAGMVLALIAVLLMTYDEAARSPEAPAAEDFASPKSDGGMAARAGRAVES
jgi:hypothetical protein